MTNQEHLELIKKGVDVWNQWRREHPNIGPELSKADLSRIQLDKIDLHEAELDGTDFYKAELRGANLHKANLHMAHLYRTNFDGADLSNAVLRGADLVRAQLVGANLREVDLRWVKLGDADLSKADLTGSAVYGASAWDITLDGATQSYLTIAKDGSPTIFVDNFETAQLVHMLRNYEKMHDILETIKKNSVLILGSFSDGGIDLLLAIAEKLKSEKYLPMIFDFDRPDTADYTETVKILAGLSRFVVVELSGPSVPQELYATIPHFKVPFVPIINRSRRIHFTFRDLLDYPWVLQPFEFEDKEELMKVVKTRIIEPAEKKFKELAGSKSEKLREYELAFPRKKGKRLQITEGEIHSIPFQSFRKKTLLRARPLNESDFEQKDKVIQTREGPVSFKPGDYLAQGIQNEEWPITQQHFITTYERVSEPDTEGFAYYHATDIRQAYQMIEDFTVKRIKGDILTGKAGDYLVRSGDKVWITNRDIFEDSYEAVS